MQNNFLDCSTKPRQNLKKAFVLVNECVDDVLNHSSCSSLTNDSDLDMMDESILFKAPAQDPSASNTNRKRRKKKKRQSVSYAQLLIDPETKALVAVRLRDRVSLLKCDEGVETANSSKFSPFQMDLNKPEKYELAAVPSSAREDRFQDQTMLTECSSNSSGAAREGPELCPCECDPGKSDLRFSDEPVVFSSHKECSGHVWMEENDLSLYLLHDSSDPWQAKSSLGCTETLKRLLMPRYFVSLASIRQVGDAKKWREGGENLSYAALNEM
ncbi:MAG: hypothetical protein SGILL_003205 [Bacillariaceae sp.]